MIEPEYIELHEFYYNHPSGGYTMSWGDGEYIKMVRTLKVEIVLTGNSRKFPKIKDGNERSKIKRDIPD